MGNKSRRKGGRIERELANLFLDAGFACEKVSYAYKPGHDLSLPLIGRDHNVEVKCRANGFAQLYGWLEKADMLLLRADRSEPLIVMPMKLAIEVFTVAESKSAAARKDQSE